MNESVMAYLNSLFLLCTHRDVDILEFRAFFAFSPKKEKRTEFPLAKDSFLMLDNVNITTEKYAAATTIFIDKLTFSCVNLNLLVYSLRDILTVD